MTVPAAHPCPPPLGHAGGTKSTLLETRTRIGPVHKSRHLRRRISRLHRRMADREFDPSLGGAVVLTGRASSVATELRRRRELLGISQVEASRRTGVARA